MDVAKLPKHLREEVYVPSADEIHNVEIDLKDPDGFGDDETA